MLYFTHGETEAQRERMNFCVRWVCEFVMVELGLLSSFFASSFFCTNISQSARLLPVILQVVLEDSMLQESFPLQFSVSLSDSSKERVFIPCQTLPL